MNVVDLTRKLVSIPSYVVAGGTAEQQLGEFIFNHLQELGYLRVEKQSVEDGRFNVIAHDGYPAQLMFCCHMDTVQPSGEWNYREFEGQVVGDRLYGLGAVDMKGGMACLLHALTSFSHTKGLWLLFDVDEEYYFRGIRKFLEEYEVHPQLAVFPEPGLEIRNGHRGLIEVYFRTRGVTGHAARPHTGKNAILGTTRAIEHLLVRLGEFTDPYLGSSSCNLAYLQGGIDMGEDVDGKLIIGERANKIPDIAEVVIDIRPAVSELRAGTVLAILESHLRDQGFFMEKPDSRLDYGSLLVSRERLGIFEGIVQEVVGEVRYANISEMGYGEGQLLNEKFGTDCVYFGPGPEDMGHRADEYVSIADLQQIREVFRRLVAVYCSG